MAIQDLGGAAHYTAIARRLAEIGSPIAPDPRLLRDRVARVLAEHEADCDGQARERYAVRVFGSDSNRWALTDEGRALVGRS